MTRYFAFLRAINVGGHVVKVDRLRQIFESLGVSSVETFIASGNVIFESTSKSVRILEKRIESGLREALGYEVVTFASARTGDLLVWPQEAKRIDHFQCCVSKDSRPAGNGSWSEHGKKDGREICWLKGIAATSQRKEKP